MSEVDRVVLSEECDSGFLSIVHRNVEVTGDLVQLDLALELAAFLILDLLSSSVQNDSLISLVGLLLECVSDSLASSV